MSTQEVSAGSKFCIRMRVSGAWVVTPVRIEQKRRVIYHREGHNEEWSMTTSQWLSLPLYEAKDEDTNRC